MEEKILNPGIKVVQVSNKKVFEEYKPKILFADYYGTLQYCD